MSATAHVVDYYQYSHKTHGETEYILSGDNTGGAGALFNEAKYITATQLVEKAIHDTNQELAELYQEIVQDNEIDDWNEFHAVLHRSLRVVVSFFSKYTSITGVELLPTPTPSIMSDGQVVLEWILSKGRLSLQFAPNRILVYAIVKNGDVTFGEEYMGVDIPSGVKSQLLRLQKMS